MQSDSFGTMTNCLLLAAILGIGVVAAITRAIYVMHAVFAVAFLPAGLMTLGANNEGMLIGISNLAFLAATIILQRTNPEHPDRVSAA